MLAAVAGVRTVWDTRHLVLGFPASVEDCSSAQEAVALFTTITVVSLCAMRAGR